MSVSTKRHDGGKIPGPANVPQVIEMRCTGALPNGKQWSFAVHGSYVTTSPNLPTLANAVFTSFSSAWSTNLGSLMHTATSFQNVWVRDMTSYTNPVYQGTGTAVVGTSASPAMPENAAIVVTENIAARGRGAKGRIYLGGWAQNADAGAGVISAAAQSGINAWCTAMVNAISAQSLTACVAQVARQAYTGITGTQHAARNATKVPVTTYALRDLIWDTQRRRIQL